METLLQRGADVDATIKLNHDSADDDDLGRQRRTQTVSDIAGAGAEPNTTFNGGAECIGIYDENPILTIVGRQ